MRTLAAIAILLPAITAEAALAQSPASSVDQLYAQAVADRRAGRNVDAVAGLRQVLAARPEDVDARLNLGLALSALGRDAEARRELEQVVAAAPDYADAHIALASLALRRGDRTGAERAIARSEALRPGDPAVVALRQQLTAPAPDLWRVDLGVSRSRLSSGLPEWREANIAVGRRLNDRSSLAVSVEQTERFGITDTYAEVRYERRFEGGGGYLAIGGAPDADYRPELAMRAGGQWSIGDRGSSFTLDGSVAQYANGEVLSLQPGLEQSLMDGRLVVGGRWVLVRDETGASRSGYSLRAMFAVAPPFRIRAGYADAPESSEGVTVDVKAASFGAEWDLTPRTTLRLNGLSEDRGAYRRDELSLGFGWRF